MVNRPKAVGTAAETALVRWLRANGWPAAERRALRGTHDAGDVTGTPGICWETKAGEAAHRMSDATCDGWMRDTETERCNARADIGILVLRRKGKSCPGDWWAYVWVRDLASLVDHGELPGINTPSDFPVRARVRDIAGRLHAAGYGDAPEEGAPR